MRQSAAAGCGSGDRVGGRSSARCGGFVAIIAGGSLGRSGLALGRGGGGEAGESQGQDAHADEVAAVDALEALRRRRAFTPSRLVPLAAQSREEPVPYSWPAKTISGMPAAW
jgi:hypothetical protein